VNVCTLDHNNNSNTLNPNCYSRIAYQTDVPCAHPAAPDDPYYFQGRPWLARAWYKYQCDAPVLESSYFDDYPYED